MMEEKAKLKPKVAATSSDEAGRTSIKTSPAKRTSATTKAQEHEVDGEKATTNKKQKGWYMTFHFLPLI